MKKRKTKVLRLTKLLFMLPVVLLCPLFFRLLLTTAPALGALGENIAVFSALITVPDATLPMLEERFSDELLTPDEIEQLTPPEDNSQPHSPDSHGEQAPPDIVIPEPGVGEGYIPGGTPPEIPAEYRGSVYEQDMSYQGYSGYLSIGAGMLQNSTNVDDEAVLEIIASLPDFSLTGGDAPEVLIMHTHATESYEFYDSEFFDKRNSWRSTDNNINVVAVGKAIADILEEQGISVLHDTTQHDYPSYNNSYSRSAVTVQQYLDEYPSIRVVIDIHRDGLGTEDLLTKPVVTIDGRKAAQIMIIAGCDDGTMNMPNWRENLRFAVLLQNRMAADYPGLARPLYFAYRKYNQDMTTGSLLIEMGSNGNTLDEALYSAELVGRALADVLNEELME